ncbi:MAG TPA: hypothetical protein GX736_01565 [Mogibacterium sp.]|nr:hypothetical protein [Mogibacterium sp.]
MLDIHCHLLYGVDSDTVHMKIKALKEELAAQDIRFDIYLGSEIRLDEKIRT